MGQYKQWLQYREVDQHLQSELTTLEQELARLQTQVQVLEQEAYTKNPIIQALIHSQRSLRLPVSQPLATEPAPTASVSPPNTIQVAPAPPLQESPGQTDPQMAVPWWLQTQQPRDENAHIINPVDPQSTRTNQYVQRWFDRWQQSPRTQEQSQEDQHL